MDIYRIIVLLHIVAGVVALLTYWGAALARKGSPLHRRIGQSYLSAMVVILVSAAYLAVVYLLRGETTAGVFLAFLVVITATAAVQGWRAIRRKSSPRDFYGRWGSEALGWVNIMAGAATLGFGLLGQVWLLVIFSAFGFVAGVGLVRNRRRVPEAKPRWWLREHYSAMLGCGIATHVAFLQLGLTRVLGEFGWSMPALLPWLAPVAVAFLAGVWLERKYGSGKVGVAGSSSASPSPAR